MEIKMEAAQRGIEKDEALAAQKLQICKVAAAAAVRHAQAANRAMESKEKELNIIHTAALKEDLKLLTAVYGGAKYKIEQIDDFSVCRWIEWDARRIYTYWG